MSERQASRTAEGAALLRAAHQVLDGEPKILDDPVAVHLLGPASLEALEAGDPLRDPTVRLARAATVLGGRFIEDQLMAAAGRGVRQYVLLGAGFDTLRTASPAGHRSFASSRWTTRRPRRPSRSGSPRRG